MLLTKELDELIRRAEIAGVATGVETVKRRYPETHAASMEVAGGLAVFTGVESPLSQTFGIGTLAPVNDAEIARINDFYESRGAAARIFVTPMTDASLARALACAGYAPSEYENVLVSYAFDRHAVRDERVRLAENVQAWAEASARAFLDVDTLAPGDERIAIVLASSEGVLALEVREGAAIVSTAAMDVRGQCAAFFAGSTLREFRGRGWHLTLIRDRVARAREAGARVMRATARPGSASERNFRRCGFSTLYTRVLWERKLHR